MTPKWHSATISFQIRRDTVKNSILELHIEYRLEGRADGYCDFDEMQ